MGREANNIVGFFLCSFFSVSSASSLDMALEAKVRTLLNAEIQSEITSDFLLTRSAILRLLYMKTCGMSGLVP